MSRTTDSIVPRGFLEVLRQVCPFAAYSCVSRMILIAFFAFESRQLREPII